MRGFEIVKILTCLPNIYCRLQALVCIDEIPLKIKKDYYIIVNRCKSTENNCKIGHWFVIYRKNSSCLECFDSCGTNLAFLKSILPYKDTIVFNSERLQPNNSKTCGLYVIHYIHNRLLNKDLHFFDLLNFFFSKKLSLNEKRIRLEQKRITRNYYCKHGSNKNN